MADLPDERRLRTADPWRDTDVIDARAPRFNQAVVGLVALLGAAFGWPLAWAIMSAQLLVGLTIGRRFCLTCLAYFELVQPRFGEGPLVRSSYHADESAREVAERQSAAA